MNSSKKNSTKTEKALMSFSMWVSFFTSLFVMCLKAYAYFLTGSQAILSDAAESVIHMLSISFATYSMWLSLKPADENHLYGHEKVGFFSAGFEGATIIVASLIILYESTYHIIYGNEIENIYPGMGFILFATFINFILAFYLIRKGRLYKSIILEANGKHIFADCRTSFGAVLALILVKFTGVLFFDPIIAILIAVNILWTGFGLVKKSIGGLMDQTDPKVHRQISDILQQETSKRHLEYHHLRHRLTGQKIFIEFHLLFPVDILLKKAHDIASEIEAKLQDSLEMQIEITTHLEPQKHHDEIHKKFGLTV